MSASCSNSDVPLPHAALLAFFQRPAPSLGKDNEAAPPPYDPPKSHADISSQHISEGIDDGDDEESTYGFWGEHTNCTLKPMRTSTSHFNPLTPRRYKGAWAFCCFWCAISVCILAAFGAFFVADLVFTQFGMGTGMARWMIHGQGRRAEQSYDMHFCLASPNRQAPGPKGWRHIAADLVTECDTEVLTLEAASNEMWKILLDDLVEFEDDVPIVSGYDGASSVDEKTLLAELGDDLLGEGDAVLQKESYVS
ncbi:hypothetical protein BKA63DRAFT_486993 [Paraphoma chrysanthemicola]|nr:hypothetical protein BKA63DRAFT_486993 [Paraphoma chrysanthemicola]